jgi:hypothetical protein
VVVPESWFMQPEIAIARNKNTAPMIMYLYFIRIAVRGW